MNNEALTIDIEDLVHPDLQIDHDAAFRGAASDIWNDALRALDEKIAHTEQLMANAKSELYRDVVDFRSLADTLMACAAHHHGSEGADALSKLFAKDTPEGQEIDTDDKKKKKKKRKEKVQKQQPYLKALMGKSDFIRAA